MPNPARFQKSSKLHQALDVLSREPLNELDLKRRINFDASVIRFNDGVIIPLVAGGYAKRVELVYRITKEGEELLNSLGRIKSKLPASHKHVPVGSYDGRDILKGAVRINADDHFKCPSRRGDMLYYRDGRVEAV